MQLRWKALRKIPKRQRAQWGILTAVLLFCIIAVCFPYDYELQHLEQQTLTLKDAQLKRASHKNRRNTLTLTSREGGQYVLFFRWDHCDNIEADLLTGNVTTLTAQILPQSPLDRLLRRHRIATLGSEETVYHTLGKTAELLSANRIGLWVVLSLFLFFWAVDIFFILICYNILIFSKTKKKT